MARYSWLFWALSAVLLAAPAVTAIAHGLPPLSDSYDGSHIAEDGAKYKKDKGDDDGSGGNGNSNNDDSNSDDSGGSENGGSDEGGGEESDDDSSVDSSGPDSEDSGGSEESSSEEDGEGSGGEESEAEAEDGEENAAAEEESESEETEEAEETVDEESMEEYEEYVEEEVVEEEPEQPVEEYPEGTFPDSYFIDRPMEKLQLQKYHITDPDGNRLMSIKESEQVEINYSLRNIQQKEQTYVMIAQIIDQDGVTIDMGWYIDTIQSGEYADWYGSWTPDAPGMCKIKIMIWDGIGENPAPLSEITEMTVLVQSASP